MGQGVIKMIIPRAVLSAWEVGKPMCAKSHTQPCHLAHAGQSRESDRLQIPGPLWQALTAPHRRLRTQDRKTHGQGQRSPSQAIFGACRNRWQRCGDHDHTLPRHCKNSIKAAFNVKHVDGSFQWPDEVEGTAQRYALDQRRRFAAFERFEAVAQAKLANG